jgi:ELWxxDGT repeat protein
VTAIALGLLLALALGPGASPSPVQAEGPDRDAVQVQDLFQPPRLVRDIHPGPEGSAPDYLAAVGSTLFFAAGDEPHGVELWKSDGTTAGTVLVKDIHPERRVKRTVAFPARARFRALRILKSLRHLDRKWSLRRPTGSTEKNCGSATEPRPAQF